MFVPDVFPSVASKRRSRIFVVDLLQNKRILIIIWTIHFGVTFVRYIDISNHTQHTTTCSVRLEISILIIEISFFPTKVLKPRERNIFVTAIDLHPVAIVQYTFTEKLSILIIEISFFPTKVLKPRERNIFVTAIELHPVAIVQHTFTEKLSILIIEVSFFPTKVLKPRQRNIFFTAIDLHPVAIVQYTFTEKLSILIIEVSFFPTKVLKPRERNIFVTAIGLTPGGISTVHIYRKIIDTNYRGIVFCNQSVET